MVTNEDGSNLSAVDLGRTWNPICSWPRKLDNEDWGIYWVTIVGIGMTVTQILLSTVHRQ